MEWAMIVAEWTVKLEVVAAPEKEKTVAFETLVDEIIDLVDAKVNDYCAALTVNLEPAFVPKVTVKCETDW
jgi:hypothetical protein